MRMRKIGALAPAGSTGNNVHTSVDIAPDIDTVAAKFEITVAGATPTVSYKLQATFDGPDIPDATADWFDAFAMPYDSATEAGVQTKTALGVYALMLDLRRRPARRVRLVTTANTNVTYEGDLFGLEDN